MDHPNITRIEDQDVHNKNWGYEVWVANSPLYCGKALVIYPGMSTSLHFHVKKTEHIFVHTGQLKLEIIEDKHVTHHILDEGDSILITPGLVHRLSAPYDQDESTVLYEFSTEHFNDDSYRIS